MHKGRRKNRIDIKASRTTSDIATHSSSGSRAIDILEIIATHLTVEAIALHALETSIREVLTGIIIFAGIFAGIIVSATNIDRSLNTGWKIKIL